MIQAFLVLALCCGQFLFGEDYRFAGKHFLGSYLDCDTDAITDVDQLISAMDEAVAASGATVLNKAAHVFPPYGVTIVYTLSESHASIHTYPEHGSCFVDLFTCGDHCSSEKFHKSLSSYLKPKQVDARLLIRDETIRETSF